MAALREAPSDIPVEVVLRPFKKSKSQQQLGYLFGVVFPAIRQHVLYSVGDSYTDDDIYQWMLDEYAHSRVITINGKPKIVKQSASKMKVNDMSNFIECVIQHAAMHMALPIQPADPHYNDQGREEASKRGG